VLKDFLAGQSCSFRMMFADLPIVDIDSVLHRFTAKTKLSLAFHAAVSHAEDSGHASIAKGLVQVVGLHETDAGAAIDSTDYRSVAAGSQDSQNNGFLVVGRCDAVIDEDLFVRAVLPVIVGSEEDAIAIV
jgi:hypothetical protein